MKSQYLKLLFIELFLITFSFFHFIFLKQYNILLYVLELFFIFLTLNYIFKLDKYKFYHKKEETLIILIMCLGYYAITYFLGFFLGFVYTTYTTQITGIIENVTYSILFIIVLENIRNIIIQKSRYYKSLVIVSCIVLTILELLFSLSLGQFVDRKVTLEIILNFIIPCLFRNVFLTYSTYYFGKEGSILYHLLMVTVAYIVPVFPNINEYINIIIQVLHPLLVLLLTVDLLLLNKDKKDSFIEEERKRKKNIIIYACSLIFLLLIVYLISNVGRYTIMAIGSESMKGTIDKGDVIFIDKKDDNYDIGDIVVFDYKGTIIVHRIVNKVSGQNVYYETKGDANNGLDDWKLSEKDIKGKCLFTIKYIGLPTVALSEFLRG